MYILASMTTFKLIPDIQSEMGTRGEKMKFYSCKTRTKIGEEKNFYYFRFIDYTRYKNMTLG